MNGRPEGPGGSLPRCFRKSCWISIKERTPAMGARIVVEDMDVGRKGTDLRDPSLACHYTLVNTGACDPFRAKISRPGVSRHGSLAVTGQVTASTLSFLNLDTSPVDHSFTYPSHAQRPNGSPKRGSNSPSTVPVETHRLHQAGSSHDRF